MMPIYEYQCQDCRRTFEKLSFKGDKQTVICPTCGSKEAKKLLSSTSFMNKGGLGACVAGSSKGFS